MLYVELNALVSGVHTSWVRGGNILGLQGQWSLCSYVDMGGRFGTPAARQQLPFHISLKGITLALKELRNFEEMGSAFNKLRNINTTF